MRGRAGDRRGGDLAVGCTTNGAQWKIPGRVGDSPMVGSGAYVDNELGACGASGDGDVMLRFSPCLLAVNALARGYHPNQAAKLALAKIASYYPTFQGKKNCFSDFGWNLEFG
eukprot:g71986.t1